MFRTITRLCICSACIAIPMFFSFPTNPIDAENIEIRQSPVDNLVTNGGFEFPDVTATTFDEYGPGESFGGWTVESGGVDHISERYWQAAEGRQSLDLNRCSPSVFYTMLVTDPLKMYSIQFSAAANPEGAPNIKEMQVWWDGQHIDTIYPDRVGHSNWDMGWVFHQYPVRTTSVFTRLEFRSKTNGCYGPVIDSVSVREMGYSIPALDLPFDYTNQKFSTVAVGRPGRVNSWFDHQYPIRNDDNGVVMLWTGIPRVDVVGVECFYGFNCYDNHNAIDFQGGTTERVYAAAPGTVVKVNRGWKNTPRVCGAKGCEYGNYVIIDHGGGYATFYAHLDSVGTNIVVGSEINANEIKTKPLGFMGGTGGWPAHLHFGVYYDLEEKWPENTVVDPYGWFGQTPDPWTVTSFYLWKYTLFDRVTAYTNGAVATSPSGQGKLTVKPGTFAYPVIMELWDAPQPTTPLDRQREVGHSLWLRVFEYSTEEQKVSIGENLLTMLPAEVEINIRYKDLDVSHINTAQLTIYHLNELTNTWEALSTSLNSTLKEATANTTHLGYFSLQAPLTCSSLTEPNDTNTWPKDITVDTVIQDEFDSTTDVDWFYFNAIGGYRYAIRTFNLAANVRTNIDLYGIDGNNLIGSAPYNSQYGGSILNWKALESGGYFIKVTRASGTYGCNAIYQLEVTSSEPMLFLPMLSDSHVDDN